MSLQTPVSRVVLDCDILSYHSNTGIVTYLLNLLAQLAELKSCCEFHVCARNPPAELVALAETGRQIKLCTNLEPGWYWKSIGNALMAKRMGATLLFIPAHRAPLIAAVPTVSVIYDLGFELFPQTFHPAERRRISWATKLAARKATRVIAISESTKRELVARYSCNPSKINVVHLGYDHEVFEPSPVMPRIQQAVLEKYGLKLPYFLHVGVLQPRKNLVRLIEAFVRVIQEHPSFTAQLAIVGKMGWKYEEILHRARAKDTRGQVVMLDAVPQEHLPILYKSSLALIFPSLYEGFGLPLLEAMACGTPVACARTSSLLEIASCATILFDPCSVTEISQAIVRLWSEPALRVKMVESGLERARHFSWQKTAQETLGIFEEVAASTPASRLA